MLIDWFTVGAQALNFLILVWLMRRFLYKPVLDAIDAREKRIAGQIEDATAKQAQAEADRVAFQGKSDAFDKERAALMAKAATDAQNESKQLMDEARQSADALSAKHQAALAAATQRVNQALAERAAQEVFAISKKALADLASTDLEAHIVEVFLSRLRALSGAAKAVLGEAFKSKPNTAAVRSAFVLSPTQRESIQTAFTEVFQTAVPLQFDSAPDTVCGVEFSVGGQKVAWSVSHYMSSLEDEVSKLLAPVSTSPHPDR